MGLIHPSSLPLLMPVLPNPETPLAFLPKDAAQQYEISQYLYVAMLGVLNIPSLQENTTILHIPAAGIRVGHSNPYSRRVQALVQAEIQSTHFRLFLFEVRWGGVLFHSELF